MINNLEQISKLLTFESEDDFYFLQIIQRKKDHPEGTIVGSNNSSRLIKAYYITSIEQLHKYFKEIKMLCHLFQARACISLNKRSFRNVSLLMLARLAENIKNNHDKSSVSLFNTICGEYQTKQDRKWIVDIDHKNKREINDIINFIDDIPPKENKFISLIESKNGYHIITKPFNTFVFSQIYSNIDVHKNNPTNLLIL